MVQKNYMTIVALAHNQQKNQLNPSHETEDRWVMLQILELGKS